MNKRILIKVTQADINIGVKSECQECPIAMAVKRQLKAIYVSVNSTDLTIRAGFNESGSSLLSRSAKRFIQRFDSGHNIKPFNFYIKLK